MNMG
ncbi:hypothetical protein F383_25765 [Gossypium arboreum]